MKVEITRESFLKYVQIQSMTVTPFSKSWYKTKYALISYGCFNKIIDENMTLRRTMDFDIKSFVQ